MKCEFHPGAKAVALCDNCSTPVCGICANFEDDATLCERCLKMHAFTKATTPAKSAEKTPASTSTPGKASAMAKLLEEGKVQDRTRHEEDEKRAEKAGKDKEPNDKFLMAVIAVCTIFIGYRITASIQDTRPLTQQEIVVQEQARFDLENCMLVFWEIAEMLQNNRVPPPSMQCTEAGAPMLVTQLDNDVIVRHPRPDLHGFSEIVVSRNNPIPEIIE